MPDADEVSAADNRRNLSTVRLVDDGAVLNIKGAGSPGGVALKEPKTLRSDGLLAFDPVKIEHTLLSGTSFVGYTFAGKRIGSGRGRSGWSGLTRVFDNAGHIGRIVLDEEDVLAGDAVITVPQSSINMKINGYPATLSRLRDGSGATSSNISWIDKSGRVYGISMEQVDDGSVEYLRYLAESISKNSR